MSPYLIILIPCPPKQVQKLDAILLFNMTAMTKNKLNFPSNTSPMMSNWQTVLLFLKWSKFMSTTLKILWMFSTSFLSTQKLPSLTLKFLLEARSAKEWLKKKLRLKSNLRKILKRKKELGWAIIITEAQRT